MKKFMMMVILVMTVISSLVSCYAEEYRYDWHETDDRVSYHTLQTQDGNTVEYFELGEAFTFEIEHYDDGRASMIIWRHVKGEDSEWLNYFCTGYWSIDQIRDCFGYNLDFCLEVMDRHGWA